MKPIPLLCYPIKNSSAPNAVVMDLFGGSGSTLIACEQTDRIVQHNACGNVGQLHDRGTDYESDIPGTRQRDERLGINTSGMPKARPKFACP